MLHIGIDPGVHEFAYAIVKNKISVGCGFCKTTPKEIRYFLDSFSHKNLLNASITIEEPDRIDDRVKVQDILNLTRVAGRLEGFFLAEGLNVKLVAPNVWKGQTPKQITKKRVVSKIKNAENLVSEFVRSKQHHLYDALGLILWETE